MRASTARELENRESVIDAHWVKLSLGELAARWNLDELRPCVDYTIGGTMLRAFLLEEDALLVKVTRTGEFYLVPGWAFVGASLDHGYRFHGIAHARLRSAPVRP